MYARTRPEVRPDTLKTNEIYAKYFVFQLSASHAVLARASHSTVFSDEKLSVLVDA